MTPDFLYLGLAQGLGFGLWGRGFGGPGVCIRSHLHVAIKSVVVFVEVLSHPNRGVVFEIPERSLNLSQLKELPPNAAWQQALQQMSWEFLKSRTLP